MASAPHDDNHVATLLAVSNIDGVTPLPVYADPVTHRLLVDNVGGGGGTIGGSIAATQVAYGSGVNTITGSSTLTTDGTTLTTGAVAITSNTPPATGIYAPSSTSLAFISNTNLSFTISSSGTISFAHSIFAVNTAGFELVSGAPSSTVPVLIPNRSDSTTGIGAQAAGNMSQIVGGVEVGRWTSTGLNNVTIGSSTAGLGTFTTLNATSLGVSGIITTGANGGTNGDITFNGSTSGSTVLQANVAAGGTLTLPVATDTLIGKATTDTLTNKTFNTAGTGNSFSINGTAITAVNGTGAVSLTTSPAFVTPSLGVATATSINKVIITQPASGSTLTLLDGATLALTGTGTALNLQMSGGSTTVIIPSGTVTMTTNAGGATLTNKRVTRRLTTTNAPGATPATNTDALDIANYTGLATSITSMTSSLTGTPVDGDLVEFRFTDNGTARAITWGASFASTTVTLPTTTVISTMLRVLVEWNGSLWQCLAVA